MEQEQLKSKYLVKEEELKRLYSIIPQLEEKLRQSVEQTKIFDQKNTELEQRQKLPNQENCSTGVNASFLNFILFRIDKTVIQLLENGMVQELPVYLGARGKRYYLNPGGNRIYVSKNVNNIKLSEAMDTF
ncbi:hypothetical protein BpHYR1_003642 [Brachionus plicatilis]|uniref:Uncharacterized protein n=1 Tax=Brachionus plicatilis TaxID=10195 RepID=A0A3M7PKP8_BRAPC|nr:hypothetical protein BpHYR1_003642 [Brachionus plicatilis]